MTKIKKIKIKYPDFEPFTAYLTPETREYDSKYDPKDLWGRVERGHTLWNFTGDRRSEDTLLLVVH